MLLDDGERGALPAQIKTLACHWVPANCQTTISIVCFWNEAVLRFTAVSWLLYSEIDLGIKWVSIWMFVDLPPPWTSNIVCSRKYIAPVNSWRRIQSPGHFKGYLCFDDEHLFQQKVYFKYAAIAGKVFTFERIC
jgi:hypothetical protein